MHRFRRIFASRFVAFVAIAAFLFAPLSSANAQSTSPLSGTVTSDAGPVNGAAVTAKGSNITVKTATNAQGKFVLNVPIGTYNVDVAATAGKSSLRVDVTSSGAAITVVLNNVKEIGRTSVTARPPVRGSGTDLTLNSETLTRSPANGSFPEILLQLPGSARGANGVVHINGDHGDINYVVDGVQIPQELNRSVGGEFDPNDVAFVESLQGAYPAQYGERFASVININTRSGVGAPGFTGDITAGSYGKFDSTLGYHAPVGKGSLVLAARNERNNRALDPPNFDSTHNSGSNANQFLRYTLPTGNDFLNVTLSHSYQTYQIPVDVQSGQPPASNNNETQDDLFATLQYRHVIGDRGTLSLGPSFKRSRIRDLGDPLNDYAFGSALNLAAGGASTDCANALLPGSTLARPQSNPAIAFGNGTCGYSLFGDRTARDIGFTLDYELRSTKHDVRYGGIYDATTVQKTYAISLQPGNFLAPLVTGANPNSAYTVTDSAPNLGHSLALYLSDSWKMGELYQLDYGVRANSFKVSSTEFSTGFGQFSPRVKLTRFFGARNNVYAYYGRFFTPFSLENVSPSSAYLLNLPRQTSVAAFDLKPQRDSVYEIGAHFGLRKGDLGLRVMQKNATDLIDDTQVGVTNLHQDINYAQGRISTQTAYYQLPLARSGRFYTSLTHTYAVARGCETQLLAPCFGAPNDWTAADHDQHWDASSGLILNDRHNGWFGIDGEYGSGLSSAACMPASGNCKVPPHLTFDLTKGIPMQNGMALTLRIGNLLNDRYLVTFQNAQGNHFARPRTFEAGLRFNTK
ncbi:MAG: hypothetical protein NVS3B28_11090 [Candidatus Velthaea sp.]